jgi:hypothetical protein
LNIQKQNIKRGLLDEGNCFVCIIRGREIEAPLQRVFDGEMKSGVVIADEDSAECGHIQLRLSVHIASSARGKTPEFIIVSECWENPTDVGKKPQVWGFTNSGAG